MSTRAVLLCFPLAAFLYTSSARAEDSIKCNVTAEPGDRVAKGKDVVIEPNARVENAVAVEGNVIVKSGASVKSALALHGNVVLEDGAKVRESVIAVSGKVKLKDPHQVKGSIVTLDKGLHVRGDDGDEVNLNIDVNGKGLGSTIVQAILEGIHECRVTSK